MGEGNDRPTIVRCAAALTVERILPQADTALYAMTLTVLGSSRGGRAGQGPGDDRRAAAVEQG